MKTLLKARQLARLLPLPKNSPAGLRITTLLGLHLPHALTKPGCACVLTLCRGTDNATWQRTRHQPGSFAAQSHFFLKKHTAQSGRAHFYLRKFLNKSAHTTPTIQAASAKSTLEKAKVNAHQKRMMGMLWMTVSLVIACRNWVVFLLPCQAGGSSEDQGRPSEQLRVPPPLGRR